MMQARRSRFLPPAITLAVALSPAPAFAAPDMAKWLAENTDMSPAQVVMIGPESVYSLEPLGAPTATREVIAHVRTEPLTQDWAKAHGFASWDAHMLFDCALGRLRLIRSATYPQPNLKGSPKVAAEQEDWLSPEPAEPAAKLLAAACDPQFAWPLRSAGTALAAKATPAPQVVAVAPPRTAPSAVPIPAPPAAPASFAVQLGRGPSKEGARVAIRRARKALGPLAADLTDTIETARVPKGRRYIAVLSGFPTAPAAAEACRQLTELGRPCFTRLAPASAAAGKPVRPDAAGRP